MLTTVRLQDGSWLYAMDDDGSFIDNFHTCFNLKSLIKIDRTLDREDIRSQIRRGYTYYRKALIYPDGDPKPFAIEPRLQLARLEMYNFAEGITLGAMLAEEDQDGAQLTHRFAGRLIRDFQLPDGHFVSRVFRTGHRHTFPFIRWPQAQLFLSVTNLSKRVTGATAGRRPRASWRREPPDRHLHPV